MAAMLLRKADNVDPSVTFGLSTSIFDRSSVFRVTSSYGIAIAEDSWHVLAKRCYWKVRTFRGLPGRHPQVAIKLTTVPTMS